MSTPESSRIQPEGLAVFRGLPQGSSSDNIEIPERSENREVTDISCTFTLCLIVLIRFLVYTLSHADIKRVLVGYDTCGNVCGVKNIRYNEWNCTGQDFTNKEYMQYLQNNSDSGRPMSEEYLITRPRECVHECKQGYAPYGGKCVRRECTLDNCELKEKNSAFTMEEGYLNAVIIFLISSYAKFWKIILACFLSSGRGSSLHLPSPVRSLFWRVVMLGMLCLYRQATKAMVWSSIAISFIVQVIMVATLRFQFASNLLFMIMNILVVLVFLTTIYHVVFSRKKVQLIIVVLKEVMKVTFDIPQLMFIPILTFFAKIIILYLFLITFTFMGTSGVLLEYKPGYLYYKQNALMIFTEIFNIVMTIWSLQFVEGVQYMILAGAVAKWYFTKNKNNLDSPLMTSVYNLFRFHLGTPFAVNYCSVVEGEVEISPLKNACILTAMHGRPIYKSVRRSAKIRHQSMIWNVDDFDSILSIFIFFNARICFLVISSIVPFVIMPLGANQKFDNSFYIPVLIISWIFVDTLFSLFEAILDILFICFCEDSLLNDGKARPYAMSSDFMEFVENAKKLFPSNKN